jgi:hypothetical protein
MIVALDAGASTSVGTPHTNKNTPHRNRKIPLPIFPLLGFCSNKVWPKSGSAVTVMVFRSSD